MNNQTPKTDNLFEPIPFGRCTDRVNWIVDRCRGRRVLDIGCLDETAFEAKRIGDHWLHGQIAAVCQDIIGIDASDRLDDLKAQYPELGHIHHGYLADAPAIVEREGFKPEVIVAGELIEHLDRPADLFETLAPLVRKHGAELLVTTPNPYGYQMLLMALMRRESQHIDHRCLMSPKIIQRAGERHGLKLTEIRTAYTRYDEFMARPGALKYVLAMVDKLAFRPAQYLFPAIGGGLLVSFR